MKNKSKIIPIWNNAESEASKKTSERMRKDFIEAANQDEERLLNDPTVKDITVSDDLFGKIMDEFRAQVRLGTEDTVADVERPEVILNAAEGSSIEDKEALLLGRMVKVSSASAEDIKRARNSLKTKE